MAKRISILVTPEMEKLLAYIQELEPHSTRANVCSGALLAGLYRLIQFSPTLQPLRNAVTPAPESVVSKAADVLARLDKLGPEQPLTSTVEHPVAANPFERITK
jgi:hypothetical protein